MSLVLPCVSLHVAVLCVACCRFSLRAVLCSVGHAARMHFAALHRATLHVDSFELLHCGLLYLILLSFLVVGCIFLVALRLGHWFFAPCCFLLLQPRCELGVTGRPSHRSG